MSCECPSSIGLCFSCEEKYKTDDEISTLRCRVDELETIVQELRKTVDELLKR